MPMNRKLYPQDWETIAFKIKESVNWTCENCNRPCRKSGETKDEFKQRLNPHYHPEFNQKPGRFILTVAHLNHVPMDCDRSNLKAWCSVCHCIYDLKQMNLKKYLKRERNGQLSLFSETANDNPQAQIQKRHQQLTIFDALDQ